MKVYWFILCTAALCIITGVIGFTLAVTISNVAAVTFLAGMLWGAVLGGWAMIADLNRRLD